MFTMMPELKLFVNPLICQLLGVVPMHVIFHLSFRAPKG